MSRPHRRVLLFACVVLAAALVAQLIGLSRLPSQADFGATGADDASPAFAAVGSVEVPGRGWLIAGAALNAVALAVLLVWWARLARAARPESDDHASGRG